MSTPEFVYQDPFPLGEDTTAYRLLPDSQKFCRAGRLRRACDPQD